MLAGASGISTADRAQAVRDDNRIALSGVRTCTRANRARSPDGTANMRRLDVLTGARATAQRITTTAEGATTVACLSLLFLAACGDGPRAPDIAKSDQVTPAVSAPPSTTHDSSAPPFRNSGRGTREPPAGPSPKAADLKLVRHFVAFALQPSDEAAGRLPVADQVQLGLSRDLKTMLDRDGAAKAASWVINAEAFRAHSGPFSALELIERQADRSGSTAVGPGGGGYEVSLGEHPHCASPPVPAPQGFGDHRRVSIQPARASIDSCLSWFTIDLFLNGGREIEAVTLDVWEP